jgi:hypothetical protein
VQLNPICKLGRFYKLNDIIKILIKFFYFNMYS